MKVFAIVALALAAVANARDCSLAGDLGGLMPIAGDATACTKATGVDLVPPTGVPSLDQAKLICTKCPGLVEKASGLEFPDCTYKGMNIKEAFMFVLNTCKAPAPTDAPTDAPTNAPTDSPTQGPTDAPTSKPTPAPSTPSVTPKPSC